MQWTVRQHEVMRECCYLGVRRVQSELLRQCGAYHTLHAIEQEASRCHMSLAKRETCPECGAVGVRLNRQTRMCPLCTERAHVSEEAAFNELLEAEAQGCEDGAELNVLRQEYDRLRQRNSRLCRRHGLPSKTQRDRQQQQQNRKDE